MISTGLEKLDDLLSGGIRNGIIFDIYGPSGTGKTLLALQISVNSLKNGGKVLFQDTTGNFRPERLLEIMKSFGLDSKLLENVHVSRITNTSEQIECLSDIRRNDDFSLIVVDNVSDLFSFEYSDKKTLEKNITFMKYMHELSLIAIEKKIPIVIINQVRSDGDSEKENMEKAISMYTHLKIKLSRCDSKYLGELFLPDKKCEFSYIITPEGLKA
jgi:DNA repair protein RAD51